MESSTPTTHTAEPADDSGETAFYVNVAIGTIGLMGNAFVCLVMLRYHNVFNSSTNKLIIHQSLVDCLSSVMFLMRRFLAVSPPAVVPGNLIGSLYCNLWWSEWVQYGMLVTSTYNLVAISTERYFATCQSVKHRNVFSTRRLKLIMASAWICGWVSEFHNLVLAYQVDGACDVSWPNATVQAIWGVFIFVKDLVIPIGIIIFAYSKIISELHHRSKARVGDNNQDARNMLSKANKNVTKTLFLVAVCFVICWTPAEINYILYNLGLNNNFVNSTMYQALNAFVVVNVCVNPFIYCFTYERFQKQVKKMICGGARGNQVGTTDDGSTMRNNTVQSTVSGPALSGTGNINA
ncbi:nociceptin receptor-like [Asterias rubens]|uniref:nociceptin receptor-like n=1 Tax=Asterias rubens TaxID=7604 RepID=UPI0014558F6C|nr:nociceptin receptor-like [Asterias rubens]